MFTSAITALVTMRGASAKPDVAKVETDKKKPAKKVEPKIEISPELLALTADASLGKADRIDGDEASGVVAFTFDDGPNPSTTPAVIDALQKYNIPATFFIVTQRIGGKSGEKSREILAREVAAGFEIGSHSVTHPDLKLVNATRLEKEIDGSIKTLAGAVGRPVGQFRAPYGSLGAGGRLRLRKLGLTEAFWSIDTLDWKAKNSEALRKKTLGMILKQNGGVVLMHDVKPITAKIIADVFDDLEAENCRRLNEGLAAAAKAIDPLPPTDKPARPPKKPLEPIIPVSIHYFLKEGKTARAIPDEVKKRTDAYRAALPMRCAARPKPVPKVDPKVDPKTAKPADPAKK